MTTTDNGLRVSLDPEFAPDPTVRVQPYRYPYGNGDEPTLGLGTVEVGRLEISSTSGNPLRRLGRALIEAADLADAVTAEHSVPVSS